MAKLEVNLSIADPTLLPERAPRKIPIIEIIIVAVVNSKIVLGSFSRNYLSYICRARITCKESGVAKI